MYGAKIELGKRLKELRGNKSLLKVSDETGVPIDYLERLEDGSKVKTASANALYKLASYYKVELYELARLGGIIVPKEKGVCCNCGKNYTKKNGVACCPECEARIGDPFS